ncbi:hypothetical protein NQZ68_013085 [Dissostichus eleginoides]|nr:hypothetical protein NQZ68_013085 [Dissostichus eleginoides]
MTEERDFIAVRYGLQCFCCFCWLRLPWFSGSSAQISEDITPGGQRQASPQWMRSVCAVSFGSQRGLSSRPRRAPPAPAGPLPGPLCAEPAPCGLAALWPFTCDCVQSPHSPPSEPEAPSPSPTSS